MDSTFIIVCESAYLQGQEFLLNSGYLCGKNQIYLIVRRFCAIFMENLSFLKASLTHKHFGRFASQIRVLLTKNTGISGQCYLYIYGKDEVKKLLKNFYFK